MSTQVNFSLSKFKAKKDPFSHEQVADLSTSTPNMSRGPGTFQNPSEILNSVFPVTKINILQALGCKYMQMNEVSNHICKASCHRLVSNRQLVYSG